MPTMTSKLPISTGIKSMGKSLFATFREHPRIMLSASINLPLASSIEYLTFKAVGVISSRGLNSSDTKLLSALVSNKTEIILSFRRNVPVTMLGSWRALPVLITNALPRAALLF